MIPDRGHHNNIIPSLLCSLLCSVLLLQCCMSAPVAIQQEGAARKGRRAQFRVLSGKSSLYLSVIRSGRLHAHAARPSKWIIDHYMYSTVYSSSLCVYVHKLVTVNDYHTSVHIKLSQCHSLMVVSFLAYRPKHKIFLGSSQARNS